jgi:flagellar hook-associated protein 1
MSMNIGRAALTNSQIAIDTIGQNIAHANDSTYAKRRVDTEATSNGFVQVRVEQIINASLEKDSLRERSKMGFYESQKEILSSIESTVNELTDNDLSSVLDEFYGSLDALSLNPHDIPQRQSVVENASKVSDLFHLISSSINNIEDSADRAIGDMSEVINSKLEQIAELNVQIIKREGALSDSPANDLRDKRKELLNSLAEIMDVTSTELSNGGVLVQSGGRTLVFQSETRPIYVDRSTGETVLRYKSDTAFVEPSKGSLGGYIQGRRDIIKVQKENLDKLARDFMWNINKVHNSGRGLTGVTKTTADTKVSPNYIDKALDTVVVDGFSLGQYYKPENGVMSLEMRNETTGTSQIYNIDITLVGDDKTTLIDLRDSIDQIENLTSKIDNYGRLSIESSSSFTFFVREDTSNVSTFLGLNNLFDGSSAGSIEVNSAISDDVRLFAAGKSASPGDNTNLLAMVSSKNADIGNNVTLMESYENFVSDIATKVSRTNAMHSNQERILSDVITKRQNYSGVNLDEEAANLLRYQQSYQAAAQYISIQNELFDILFRAV